MSNAASNSMKRMRAHACVKLGSNKVEGHMLNYE